MYTSECLDEQTYNKIQDMLRNGYIDIDGITRKPNNQVADMLALEANLGCRIGDIDKLTTDDFILDGGVWKICIKEQKTKKTRVFIVPDELKRFIDEIASKNYSDDNRLFGISKAATWKALRILTRTIGITNCSSHAFRKYAAQRLYDATGGDTAAVCTFLQHGSIKTTTAYLRRSSRHMEDALSNIVSIA